MLDQFTWLGGFDCASHRWRDGTRVDSIAGSRHDALAARDYALLKANGLGAARDGLRWHLIERTPGHYNWSSWLPMLRAARAAGLPVIWDLVHWGVPDDIDILSPAFVDRAAAFAGAAARVHADEIGGPSAWVAVNEISFWSWAGGDTGGWPPFLRDCGDAVKRQLARAAIAVSHAVRNVDPHATFLTSEPLIAVHPRGRDAEAARKAALYEEAQHEAAEMLLGRRAPELGGDETLIDLVGVNYYPANQFELGGWCVPPGDHRYRPLPELLWAVSERFERPLVITETGCEGEFRPYWLQYVYDAAQTARGFGADVRGLCVYPVLDYPGWEDRRICPCGLFGCGPDRAPHAPSLAVVRARSGARRVVDVKSREALYGR